MCGYRSVAKRASLSARLARTVEIFEMTIAILMLAA
jgi:hypothetical protein